VNFRQRSQILAMHILGVRNHIFGQQVSARWSVIVLSGTGTLITSYTYICCHAANLYGLAAIRNENILGVQ